MNRCKSNSLNLQIYTDGNANGYLIKPIQRFRLIYFKMKFGTELRKLSRKVSTDVSIETFDLHLKILQRNLCALNIQFQFFWRAEYFL